MNKPVHETYIFKFGLEMEFIISELKELHKPQVKNRAELKSKAENYSKTDKAKFEQVKNFNTEQLMLFELHDIEPETKDMLEYLFGTGRGDNSYYDAVIGEMRCAEVKIKPVELEGFLKRYDKLVKTLYQKCENYGLKITDPKIQLNVSAWKQGKNIFDPLSKSFLKEGKDMMVGIFNNILSKKPKFLYISTTGAPSVISMGIGRDNFARLVGEGEVARLELRLSRSGATIKDINLNNFINETLESKTPKELKTKNVKRGIFKRKSDNFKIILHVLQGSEIIKTSVPFLLKLRPPENYISGWLDLNFAKICLELGYEPIAPSVQDNAKFLDRRKYLSLVQEYKNATQKRIEYIKILEAKDKLNKLETLELVFLKKYFNGMEIFWPEDEIFYAHFESQAEACMTILQVQKFFKDIRILGNKIIWPKTTNLLGKEFKIDRSKLKQEIKFLGIAHAFKTEKFFL